MAQITFEDKVSLNINPSIPAKNKVQSDDINEIKDVINENDNNVGNLSDLTTNDKTSIVNAINEIKTDISINIITDSEPVKTGRKVDGKDEYVKRITIKPFPNATTELYPTGITNATLVRFFLFICVMAQQVIYYFHIIHLQHLMRGL